MGSGGSLSSLFASAVARDAPAARVGARTITFGELERDVALLAAKLRGRGGEHWLLLSEDAYALAIGFLGTLYAGHTVVLPANLQVGHLGELTTQVDGALVHGCPTPGTVNELAILDHDPSGPRLPLEAFDPSTAKVILHTSGTTGGPLAVSKSLACFEAELAALDRQFQLTDPDIVLATVPAHHIYGLLFRVLWPLVAGRPFRAEMIHFPGELAHALTTAERNLLISSPAFLARAIEVLDLDALDHRLVGIFSSGGPLPQAVAAAYNDQLTHPLVEVYGSTETGGIGHRSVHDATTGTPWTPLPGVALSVGSDGGALTVHSPFLHDIEAFETGDCARLLADGRFELLGRADRLVKVEERRISLTDVENKLAACVEISAVRVISLIGAGRRTALAAVVIPSPEGWTALAARGKRALTDTLRAALMPYLDATALPRKWRFVRKLPETAQGKTPISSLAALFEADGRAKDEGATRPIILSRELEASTLRLKLELQPDLLYFDGHFDDHPILPGVVQLDWAIGYAREAFGFKKAFRRVEALKFFRVLCVHETVDLEVRLEPEEDRLHFRYRSDTHDHSVGRVLFEGAE